MVAAVDEFEEAEQHFGALGAKFARRAVDVHVLPRGEFVVQAGLMKDDAEAFADVVRAGDVDVL